MAWSLHRERTRDTAHKIVSEVFSSTNVSYKCFYQQGSGPTLQCVQSKGRQFLNDRAVAQYYNVFNRVVQIECDQSKGGQSPTSVIP